MRNTVIEKLFCLAEAGMDHVWAKFNWSSDHISLLVLQCQEPLALLPEETEDRLFPCLC